MKISKNFRTAKPNDLVIVRLSPKTFILYLICQLEDVICLVCCNNGVIFKTPYKEHISRENIAKFLTIEVEKLYKVPEQLTIVNHQLILKLKEYFS